MFTKKTPVIDPLIDEYNRLLAIISNTPVYTEQYANAIDQLAKLHALKESLIPKTISKDTLIVAGANLLGILVIVGFEHANVITSKALNFVFKLK